MIYLLTLQLLDIQVISSLQVSEQMNYMKKMLFNWPSFHLFFQEVFQSHLIATFTPYLVPGLNAYVLYSWSTDLAL